MVSLSSCFAEAPRREASLPLPFLSSASDRAQLRGLDLDGRVEFDDVRSAATDFGHLHTSLPSAVVHPRSVADVAKTVRLVFELGQSSNLTIAARGHGHSLQGQAQASGGIVVNMESLKSPGIRVVREGGTAFAEAAGGELWISVLNETLKQGLAPRSWTDYLYLTVGGTLSNAGVSGQAFRHGPQISNVHQLEVVTGRGDVKICSEKENAELFHGVLGGLGQFGIITRARIVLEPAPQMVKWIRVLYTDFAAFTRDQEMLISEENTFDYIEGFVIINRTSLLSNWRSSFNPKDPAQASLFESHGKTLFCLEMTKNFNHGNIDSVDQEVDRLMAKLSCIPSTVFMSDVPYVDFLDRVHASEVKLQSQGLWEVPHPWLNLFIPRSKIHQFAREVFGKILTDSSNGPILIYPLNKTRWDGRTSAVTPEEDVFYLVAFLYSASSSPEAPNSVKNIQSLNRRVLRFCEKSGMGMKQYLPHYELQSEWKAHFGERWKQFAQRKMAYDPLAILGPGQRIFQKAKPFL
ncbi:unnamed protein product [Victoria cruziana]